MIDPLSSLASGGLLGLVGSLLNKGFTFMDSRNEYKKLQAEQSFELQRLKIMQRMQAQQSAMKRQIVHDTTHTMIKEASYAHDTNLGKASRWVVNVLRFVRPLLTLGLVALTTLMWYHSLNVGDEALRQSIVEAVLFCTTAALTWWFGDRVHK